MSLQAPDRADAAPEPGEVDAPARSASVRYLLTALGTVAALTGAATILWLVVAPLLGLSLVVFRTGSMSPAIPQGALAVVHRVDAADLTVGRVAMLQRPGEAPISHRVLDVATDPTDPAARVVTMQGDDNPVPDPEPYVVTSGREVLVSVPHGAAVLALLRSPLAMGLLTAAAAAVVLRAFWPKTTDGRATPDAGPEQERNEP